MSLTWRQIRDYARSAVRNHTAMTREFFDLATLAYRELCARVDVAELYNDEVSILVAAGTDHVSLDSEVFAIYSAFNLTHGQEVLEEPEGMRGRVRFLEAATGMPAPGPIRFLATVGNRLYVRGTPEDDETLRLIWKAHPPDVIEADLDEHPITPAHLDAELIRLTAAYFLEFHPEAEEGTTRAVTFRQNVAKALSTAQKPKTLEGRNKRVFIHQPGYSFNPR